MGGFRKLTKQYFVVQRNFYSWKIKLNVTGVNLGRYVLSNTITWPVQLVHKDFTIFSNGTFSSVDAGATQFYQGRFTSLLPWSDEWADKDKGVFLFE